MTPINELAAQMREAAEKAGSANWNAGHLADDNSTCNCPYVFDEQYMGGVAKVYIGDGRLVSDGGNDAPPLEEAKANLRHIAIANPANVLAILADRDDLAKRLEAIEAWTNGLEFHRLHEYQHAHNDHATKAYGGGSIIEWAADELAALRADRDALRTALSGIVNQAEKDNGQSN